MTPQDLALRLQSPRSAGAWMLQSPDLAQARAFALATAQTCAHASDIFLIDEEAVEHAKGNGSRLESFRKLLQTPVQSTSAAGGLRVVILPEIEHLPTGQVSIEKYASVLLKMLEEPGQHLRFLLTTARPGALPKTLISRTLRLRVPGVPHKAQSPEGQILQTLTGPKGASLEDALAPMAQGLQELLSSKAGFSRKALSVLMDQALQGATSMDDKNARVGALGQLCQRLLARVAKQEAEIPDVLKGYQDRCSNIERVLQADHFLRRILKETQTLGLEPKHACLRLLLCLEFAMAPKRA